MKPVKWMLEKSEVRNLEWLTKVESAIQMGFNLSEALSTKKDTQLESFELSFVVVQSFSSVAQLWPTLHGPLDHSTPGLPVHHQLPESTQNSSSLSWWCHPTISSSVIPFSSCPQSFLASGSFQMSQLFTSGGQSIGVSASTSVLPMNVQD